MSYKVISNDKILVTYNSKLDYDIITSHYLDFLKILNKPSDKEFPAISTISVAISAAINAYARVNISELKL